MDTSQQILLCCDLDRTIIPNGYQPESAPARPAFRELAQHPDIYLAYVSGRDRKLVLDAIEEFFLPMPSYVIGDVGTTMYRVNNGNWRSFPDWSREIGRDWRGLEWEKLSELFVDVEQIRLQEPEKQSRYKLSFYTDRHADRRHLIKCVHRVLAQKGIRANVIWSVDEVDDAGLLDILPARASKLQAVQFLMRTEQFAENRTVFAGDSGNDLDVLTSGMQSILVKNAADEVRRQAVAELSVKHVTARLYLPKGNFSGMNGNYAAGVLEGLAHFFPETSDLIAAAVERSRHDLGDW